MKGIVKNNLTYAKKCILEKINQKKDISNFQDHYWTEYEEYYNDYNDCHGDYYDAE